MPGRADAPARRRPSAYVRKLTAPEVDGKFIAVVKGELHRFPPPGEPFVIQGEGFNLRVHIAAVTVADVGAWQERFRIQASSLFVQLGLERGDVLVFRKTAEKIYQVQKLA